MGHIVGKDLYRELARKIDGLTVRVPPNETLFELLRQIYSADDAELIVKMPFGLSTLRRLMKVTHLERAELERRLADMASRGLVLDIVVDERIWYAPSPMVIGVFEFTMMRTGDGVDHQKWAGLFHDYLHSDAFLGANFGDGQRVSLMRTLPHEGTVELGDHVEILDFERATAIIEETDRFAMGLCSCRHAEHHRGAPPCEAPAANCSTLGSVSVDFMVRNGLAREVSRTEMLENLERSRELGLVLNADNVRRRVSFLCHCCGCCCTVLKGLSQHGYANTIVTSSFVAAVDPGRCNGCGICARRCPIKAIDEVPDPDPRYAKFGRPEVDEEICIGCGVCALRCRSGAIKLGPRARRVLHPETIFERTILQCLERGTLENQLFDDPSSKTQAFLRALVGGFLRIPAVKQALMSDLLRSRFLNALSSGASILGKSRFTEL